MPTCLGVLAKGRNEAFGRPRIELPDEPVPDPEIARTGRCFDPQPAQPHAGFSCLVPTSQEVGILQFLEDVRNWQVYVGQQPRILTIAAEWAYGLVLTINVAPALGDLQKMRIR